MKKHTGGITLIIENEIKFSSISGISGLCIANSTGHTREQTS